jgi:tetratricopeptide (TPR) repeat protein
MMLNKIGVAYNNANLREEAQEYYYAALKAINFSNNRDLRLAAMIYFNLAGYQENNIFKIEFYEKSLKIEKEIYGDIHEDTSRTIAAIGLTYLKLGDFESALIKLNEAKDIAEAIKCDLSELYNYFGFYYREKENFNKSLEYYENSFLLICNKFGDNSVAIMSQLQTIGEILYYLEDYEKSLNYLVKAEHLLIKAHKKDFDALFYLKSSIGVVNFYLRNYDLAIDYLSNAVNIFNVNKSSYQEGQINNTYYYLGYSFYCKSEYESANSILKKLSEITIDSISKEDYINNQELIGNSFFHSEKYQNAIDAYSRIIPLMEKNTDKIQIVEYIGSCYEHLERYDNAIKNYFKVIDSESVTNPEFENIYWRIGYCHFKVNQFANAILNLEKCFTFNKHALYAFYIANSNEALGHFEKALDYFLQSAEIRKTDPKAEPENESTKDSIHNTIRVAKLIGKENELPEWIKNHNK